MRKSRLLTAILIFMMLFLPLYTYGAEEKSDIIASPDNAETVKEGATAKSDGIVGDDSENTRSYVPEAKTNSERVEKSVSAKSAGDIAKTLGAVGALTVYLYGHDDIKAKWSKVSGATGYRVYYKKASSKTWSYRNTLNNYYELTDLTDGCRYMIRVVPYIKDSRGSKYLSRKEATVKSIYTLKRLMVSSVSRSGLEKVNVKWNNIQGETGYQISRSSSKTGTYIISTYKTTTGRQKSVKAKIDRCYYYKVRAYKDSGSIRVYGPWSYVKSYKVSRNYYPKAVRLEKDGKWLDLRKLSGQKLYGYDIFQGSCTDGKYGYYVLYNKKAEKCKIVKIRLSDYEIVRVSGVLNIHHGNSIAYNSSTKRIAAVHMSRYSKRIAIINPITLTVERDKDIDVPLILSGATIFQTKAIEGFNAIAYDTSKKQYILRIRKSGNFLVTDGYLNPVKYIVPKVKKEKDKIYAGMGMVNGYIASEQAPEIVGSGYNAVKLYTREGEYVGCINISKSYELESVFYAGGYGYAAFYHSYYSNGKFMRNNYIYRFAI